MKTSSGVTSPSRSSGLGFFLFSAHNKIGIECCMTVSRFNLWEKISEYPFPERDTVKTLSPSY